MIHYRQYRPAFFEGFDTEEGDVANCDELLKLGFISQFADHRLHRFSIGSGVETPIGRLVTLMAEYKKGTEWWVVAYLWPETSEELAALPKWEPKDKLSS